MAYLDVQIVVELESLSKEEDELEQVGELPHVPDAMQHGWLRQVLTIIGVGFLEGALARRRHLQFASVRCSCVGAAMRECDADAARSS